MGLVFVPVARKILLPSPQAAGARALLELLKNKLCWFTSSDGFLIEKVIQEGAAISRYTIQITLSNDIFFGNHLLLS